MFSHQERGLICNLVLIFVWKITEINYSGLLECYKLLSVIASYGMGTKRGTLHSIGRNVFGNKMLNRLREAL